MTAEELEHIRKLAADDRETFRNIVASHENWAPEQFEAEWKRCQTEFDGNPWTYQYGTNRRIMIVIMGKDGRVIPDSSNLLIGAPFEIK